MVWFVLLSLCLAELVKLHAAFVRQDYEADTLRTSLAKTKDELLVAQGDIKQYRVLVAQLEGERETTEFRHKVERDKRLGEQKRYYEGKLDALRKLHSAELSIGGFAKPVIEKAPGTYLQASSECGGMEHHRCVGYITPVQHCECPCHSTGELPAVKVTTLYKTYHDYIYRASVVSKYAEARYRCRALKAEKALRKLTELLGHVVDALPAPTKE
jgi:hypothetical protein